MFSTLAIPPLLDRLLLDADEKPAAACVALISERLWRVSRRTVLRTCC